MRAYGVSGVGFMVRFLLIRVWDTKLENLKGLHRGLTFSLRLSVQNGRNAGEDTWPPPPGIRMMAPSWYIRWSGQRFRV